MDGYVITFQAVMAAAVTGAVGLLIWFLKNWVGTLTGSIQKVEEKLTEQNDRINERIEKLEEKQDREIKELAQEVKDMKIDFPTMFVLREDFFRAMNGTEDKMGKMDQKLDQLLLMAKKE